MGVQLPGSSSGFSSTNVNALTNNDKLPFIWSVACVNGNFVGTTCFAEAWLRATNGGEPSGAVATLMSTINQSWNPPMEGQDEMVDLLVESYAGNIKRTFGGLSMNGCMKMNDTYGSGGDEMTDTWTCFGDPSVVVRTAIPQSLTISHNPVILLGSNQFTVNCNVEGALVCLTINNQIIGKAYVNGGSATVSFVPLTSIGTVTIAVTAYNYIPYLGEADIVPASGPYLSLSSYIIDDAIGNNNGEADYDESITLNVTLENAGSAPSDNVSAVLSTADPYVLIYDDSEIYGTITNGSTVTINNAFALTIADNIPDQYAVQFSLVITGDAKDTWESSFSIVVNAPQLETGNLTINDSGTGNGNGILDPGETANVIIDVINNGHSLSPVATGLLSCLSPNITIVSGTSVLGIVPMGGTMQATFTISADVGTPIGTAVDLDFDVTAGNYPVSEFYTLTVGQIPVVIIDLDPTPSSGATMQTSLSNLGISFDYVTAIPVDLELYSTAFVCLGIYSNNHVLTSTEGQTLATFLTAGGKLYMEGGDTWAYDTQTAVHSMFSLTGTADGSGDLGTIEGQASAFTTGMTFSYSGENSYIDHIDPSGSAFSLFHNQNPDYSCAVANDAGTYRTIGASFEFGGLNNGTTPSTKDILMEKYIEFFGLGVNPEPNFSLNPGSLDFGNVLIGEISVLQFTISNSGGASLTGNITTPIAFSVSEAAKGDPKSGKQKNSISYNIPAFSSQVFDLTFSPLDVVCYNGNVDITSNDPDYLAVVLPVSGCGIEAPDISVNPALYDVGLPPNGSSSEFLTIENIGGSQLDFDATIIYDDGSKDLTQVIPLPSNYWTGTCTATAKTETSLVKGQPANEYGWMKFDISTIPDGATINSIEFNGYVNNTYYPYWNINPVTNDPHSADAPTLYSDIGAESSSGYYLYQSESSSYTTGWKSHILGGTANTDMENALGQDWFTIGIMDRDLSATYYIWFDGWNEANPPYLVVDYTYVPSFSWLTLDGGSGVTGIVDPAGNKVINVGFDATGLSVGIYTAEISITSNDPDENPLMIPVTLTVSETYELSLQLLLEGPFNGTEMNTNLNDNGLLPLSQPYL
ncbi:MAG: C25 family peptidase C-terminal domain-containing protein, partial [Bacteroidales bacterium]